MARRRRLTQKGKRKQQMVLAKINTPYPRVSRFVTYKKLPPLGQPTKMLRRFRYVEQATLDPGAVAGVPNVNIYGLNCLYDPQIQINGSGGRNAQPRGYDQMFGAEDGNAWYKRYRVIGAKVTLQYWSVDGSHVQRVGMCMKDHATPIGDSYDYTEDKRNKDRIVTVTSGSKSMGVLTYTWSAKKYWGKQAASDDDTAGNYDNNPSEKAYLHLWADSYAADSAGIRYELKIDFITLCFDPVTPAES